MSIQFWLKNGCDKYIEAISKEVFEKVISSSNIIKTPKSSRDRAKKRREKKKKKRRRKKSFKSLFK
jgi:ribosomal protein L19E